MKINCNKTNNGIEVTVYDAPAECRPVISNDSDNPVNDAKPIRIKRKFPLELSPKQRETVCIALTRFFENYNLYYTMWKVLGKEALIERMKNDLSSLSDYQLNSLNMVIPEICIPVAFEKSPYTASQDENSHMNAENSLCVALIGGFGFGKTTLLKNILDFDDSYRFLLVDGGRTTLCRTYIRAFIEDSRGNIHIPSSESDENIQVLRDNYHFQNRVTIYNAEQAYVQTIIPALERSFQLYKSLLSDRFDRKLTAEDWEKTLRSFYTDEQFSLDSFFGTLPEDPLADEGFYGIVASIFEEAKAPGEDFCDFLQCDNLKKAFQEKYESALQKIEDKLKVTVTHKDDKILVSFLTQCDDFAGGIDNFYRYFTDNTIKGDSLRVFVQEIYLETSFSGQHIDELEDGLISLPSLKDGDALKFHSILFVDTVGVGHVKKSQKGLSDSGMEQMSYEIAANLDILTDANVIVMLDKANESMREGVISQLYTLETYGLIDKVVLAYSYYNQFIKMDMENDADREYILLNLLLKSLRSLYPSQDSEQISKKAKKIYDSLTQNRQAVVFLKGLVSRTDTSVSVIPNQKKSSRRRNSDPERGKQATINSEDEKAKELNDGIESSNECLIDLIEKIVRRYEAFQNMKKQRASIQSHYHESPFQVEYTNHIYNRLPASYDQYQASIYCYDPPAYNTTGALCRNASNGIPVHSGISQRLAPVADFCMLSQHLIAEYLDSTVIQALEIRHDETGHAYDKILGQTEGLQLDEAQFVDFLNEEIKVTISNKIREFSDTLMVVALRDDWMRLAQDFGAGVKQRRAKGIYELLRNTTQLGVVQQKIMKIVMESIHDIIEEYSI